LGSGFLGVLCELERLKGAGERKDLFFNLDLTTKDRRQMKAMIDFFRTMLKMPKPWLVWLTFLMAANMVGPVVFIKTPEACIVILAAMAGAAIQIAIFRSKGFVRLLGIGHLPWVPLVLWLWSRLEQLPQEGFFRFWVLAVIFLNTLSLIIDATDVFRYISGDREPLITI